MMFEMSFKTDNAAFDEWLQEIPRILRDVADHTERGEVGGNIIDVNGNTVGLWSLDTFEA